MNYFILFADITFFLNQKKHKHMIFVLLNRFILGRMSLGGTYA